MSWQDIITPWYSMYICHLEQLGRKMNRILEQSWTVAKLVKVLQISGFVLKILSLIFHSKLFYTLWKSNAALNEIQKSLFEISYSKKYWQFLHCFYYTFSLSTNPSIVRCATAAAVVLISILISSILWTSIDVLLIKGFSIFLKKIF